MIGPHIILPTDAALRYARVAGIVKAVNDPKPLATARPDAIRVFRCTFGDGNSQLDLTPEGVVEQVVGQLAGFNHPNLYLELLNEVHGEIGRYIDWTRRATAHAHQLGYQVAGFSWATGDYGAVEFAMGRLGNWVGVDAVALHAYWGLPPNEADPGSVLTPWNALRFRTYWQPGDPPVILTEVGRDRIRDGDPAIDDGYVGAGWRAQGIADSQYLAELLAFGREIQRDAFVLGATVFCAGTGDDWRPYDIDPLIPALVDYAGRTPALPESHQPVQERQGAPLVGDGVAQPAEGGQEAAMPVQEAAMPQPITPEQLGPGFWALYEQMGHKTGSPIEKTWSIMKAGEPEQSVLEIVRFRNGRAVWDRDSNAVVYIGKDRLVMRAYDGKVAVLLP